VTWRSALRLGRVSNVPTVWTNVLAAATLAGVSVGNVAMLVVALACSLFYLGGMFLNDAFDREFDARVRPERPIPSGAVSAATVFASGFALLGAGLLAIAAAARLTLGGAIAGPLVAALALAGLIAWYDARHKDNAYGPLLMGLCRVFVYLTTAATLTGGVSLAVVGGAVVLLAYLIGLTYVARQENLTEMQNLWPLLFLAVPFLWGLPTLFAGGVGSTVYLGFLGWVALSISHLGWRPRLDVPRAVVSLIAGISLLDGLLIAGQGGPLLVGLAVLGFVSTLLLQRAVPGT
jgi:4-hydroxybenzoate polyprenyltransferase